MKIWAIALNTFREAIRNKIMYTILFFAALVIALSAFYGSVTIGDRQQVIKDFGLFSLSFFGSIISMLSGVNLLNKELKKKTIYNILSKPVSRAEFVLGKYLGLSLTVTTLVGLMGLCLSLFLTLLERQFDPWLWQGIYLAVLESLTIAAVVIFFSSMSVTPTLPALLTLGTYLAGHSLKYLKYYLQISPAQGPMNYLNTIISWAIPDLSLFNANALLVYGQSLNNQQLFYTSSYCLSFSSCALILAIIIFKQRELN